MPSSRPNTIPVVISLIKQLKPASILDVGVGFGKWGHLFREYTDILESEADSARYRRENWKIRIDGVEGFPEYITDLHRYVYDNIYLGDVREIASSLKRYDVIFLGDIIEHMGKEEGRQLLTTLVEKINKAIIVSTPKYETSQPALCNNELERHRSLWSEDDFLSFPHCDVATVTETILLAVIVRPGVSMPRITHEIAGRPRTIPRRIWRRMRRAFSRVRPRA